MNNKKMLLALTAASAAITLLPAMASAGAWHQDPASSFTIFGGATTLNSVSGNINCTSVSGSGKYDTGSSTTGTINIVFQGCTGPFGAHCTSAGQPTGSITTTTLPFHNVMLGVPIIGEFSDPGLLLTPGTVDNKPTTGDGHFATFSCLGITVIVKGNGVLGEFTSSICGSSSSSRSVRFKSLGTGSQYRMQVTSSGTKYDLKRKTGGGEYETAALEMNPSFTYENLTQTKMNCT